MSAKIPRRTFAAPLVVTLAMPLAGACLVTSGTKSPPPSGGGGPVTDHRTSGSGDTTTATNPPGPHVNPPRVTPTDPTVKTDPPPDLVQQTTLTQQAALRTWHVYQNAGDKQCYAALDVQCPAKATCNPPPPLLLASCPTSLTMPQGLTIREDSVNACAVYYPMPDCPTGTACNPPRPQTIECPKY